MKQKNEHTEQITPSSEEVKEEKKVPVDPWNIFLFGKRRERQPEQQEESKKDDGEKKGFSWI